MNLPGFTAQVLTAENNGPYRESVSSSSSLDDDSIVPTATMHWGNLKNDGCIGPGTRKYSAILWDIPWGHSWEDACRDTPVNRVETGGTDVYASSCVNTGTNMWGEFHVPATDCSTGCAYYTTKTWCIPPTMWCEKYCGDWWSPGSQPSGEGPYLCGLCVEGKF